MKHQQQTVTLAAASIFSLLIACNNDNHILESTPTVVPEETAISISTTPLQTTAIVTRPISDPTRHVVVTASPDEPVASTAYIPTSELQRVMMTSADGSVVVLPIEVPPRNEYNVGLSGRRNLGERGMLFWYEEPTRQSFWMRNTYYDLSIAFINGNGIILEIMTLKKESEIPQKPDEPYRYAIEAPVDWYVNHDIEPGDQVRLDFEIPDSLRQ